MKILETKTLDLDLTEVEIEGIDIVGVQLAKTLESEVSERVTIREQRNKALDTKPTRSKRQFCEETRVVERKGDETIIGYIETASEFEFVE